MKNPINSYLLPIWIFAFALVFFQCSEKKTSDTSIEINAGSSPDEVTLSQAQFESSSMSWDSISIAEFSEKVSATGTVNISAEGKFDISTYFGGFIGSMKLLEGQKVAKGEVLFTMVNPEFIQMQQDYLDARSQLAYLKNDFERQKLLSEENISSQKNYLKAEADFQSILAKSESLKKKLHLINLDPAKITPENINPSVVVYSPVAGYVEEVLANQGTYLNPADIAIKLIDKRHLHVELKIFEKDAMIIQKGQSVLLRFQDRESESMEGEVFLVGQSVNEKRLVNVQVYLKDEKEGEKLVPGMYVESQINFNNRRGPSLADEAVLNVEGKNYVLLKKRVDNDLIYLEKREILLGENNQGRVEILNASDFDPKAQFLAKGSFNLTKN